MKRRHFISLLAAVAAWPVAARAQQPGKVYHLGLLANGPAVGPTDERRKTLLSDLAARGFADGQNLVVVQRAADARPERLDGLMVELKAANVDVIVTFGYPAALAAKKAIKTYRSSSPARAIRSRLAWSMGWRGPAATSPA